MLTLEYRSNSLIPVEAEAICPDLLKDKSLADIAKTPVQHGNAPAPLGEFFTVEGDPGDEQIRIEGDCRRLKWIGAGMKSGTISIHGDIGMHLGSEMAGGEIIVHGNAADWVGAEMRGGKIHVHGNAGHLVGSGYRGSRYGMRGGVILIDGNADNEIGNGMRRGLIAVGGDAGDFLGVSMIAGTVFLFGKPGIRVGAGMKRGTIALFGSPETFQPLMSFRYDCAYQPQFMSIYLRRLATWGLAPAASPKNGEFRRYSGDLVALGKGEILQWTGERGG